MGRKVHVQWFSYLGKQAADTFKSCNDHI
jgi:hypothetical protein